MDVREDSDLENVLRFAFYLPLALIWFFGFIITTVLTKFYFLRFYLQKSEPTQSEIEKVDEYTFNSITLKELYDFN